MGSVEIAGSCVQHGNAGLEVSQTCWAHMGCYTCGSGPLSDILLGSMNTGFSIWIKELEKVDATKKCSVMVSLYWQLD